MTLNAFPTWCKHFVEPLERGPDGKTRNGAKYYVLFLDGHSSRWSVEGLEILKANNVLAICIPSHTSVWGQVSVLLVRCTAMVRVTGVLPI
jgi:hypothetical protein